MEKIAVDVVKTGAIEGIKAAKELRQAIIDIKIQPIELRDLHQRLLDVQAKFSPLLSFRLRTESAKTAVRRLLGVISRALADLEQRRPELKQQQPGQQDQAQQQQQQHVAWHLRLVRFCRQQLLPACCRCLTGPSELSRFQQLWAKELEDALKAVRDEGEANLLPQTRVHFSLPKHCVTNDGVLQQLINNIKQAHQQDTLAAATAAPETGSYVPPPPVVQLLGMPGMGKSTIALQVALALEQGA